MDNIIKICHECGSELVQHRGTKTFLVRGVNVHIPNVISYECAKCGVCVYTDDEVMKIENYIKENYYGV